jgi:hypothetical protein
LSTFADTDTSVKEGCAHVMLMEAAAESTAITYLLGFFIRLSKSGAGLPGP